MDPIHPILPKSPDIRAVEPADRNRKREDAPDARERRRRRRQHKQRPPEEGHIDIKA